MMSSSLQGSSGVQPNQQIQVDLLELLECSTDQITQNLHLNQCVLYYCAFMGKKLGRHKADKVYYMAMLSSCKHLTLV